MVSARPTENRMELDIEFEAAMIYPIIYLGDEHPLTASYQISLGTDVQSCFLGL